MPDLAAPGYQPIEDYGVIGDLHTVALVGRDGSIDFCSYPHFDSPTVFAALLDRRRGGRFSVRPCLDRGTRKQMYLPETNVLITRFLDRDGVAEVSDFMPIGDDRDDHPHAIIRRVKTVRGEVSFDMVCDPRFDYGRAGRHADQQDGSILFSSEGPDNVVLRLTSDVAMEQQEGAAVAHFTLTAGQSASFVLEPGDRPSRYGSHEAVTAAFKQTVNYWRTWLSHSKYRGRWREVVDRSALVLKLLVSDKHGSLVAAPTFGLPEELGGERNWDYRYTWIRDASFTLYALIRLGYTEEAGHFMAWIEDRCRDLNPDGSIQIMYGHDGRKELTEAVLDHFEGEPISFDLWRDLTRLIDWVCVHWRQPDEGIWEVRGGRQEFGYSRLMCWVAVDRGVRLAQKRSFPAPLERWRQVRDEIYLDLVENFWDDQRQAFVQHRGATTVDAACLLMPMVKFIGPKDPRWLSTLAAVEEDLVDDSLVFRYRGDAAASDGLDGGEGTFNMCSFWYAEVLARSGDVQKARFVFEKMLGYANHVGLYAEELGPHGEHLGNFPQAFTHLGLISAAYAIDRKLSGDDWVA